MTVVAQRADYASTTANLSAYSAGKTDSVERGDTINIPEGGGAAASPAAQGADADDAAATKGGVPSSSKLSRNGLNLIKGFAGLRLNAYRHSAGVWTIGYGHTGGVKPGDRITQAQAKSLLRRDVGWAEDAVRAEILAVALVG